MSAQQGYSTPGEKIQTFVDPHKHVEAVVAHAPAVTHTAVASGGQLPFTGLDVAAILIVGSLLLLAGLRHPPARGAQHGELETFRGEESAGGGRCPAAGGVRSGAAGWETGALEAGHAEHGERGAGRRGDVSFAEGLPALFEVGRLPIAGEGPLGVAQAHRAGAHRAVEPVLEEVLLLAAPSARASGHRLRGSAGAPPSSSGIRWSSSYCPGACPAYQP